MSKALRILLVAIPAGALALLTFSWLVWPIDVISGPYLDSVALLFWIGVTLVASSSPIHVPRGSLVSVAAAPIIAAAILGGPTAGAVVAAVGTIELRELRGRIPWYGVLYNLSLIHI